MITFGKAELSLPTLSIDGNIIHKDYLNRCERREVTQKVILLKIFI